MALDIPRVIELLKAVEADTTMEYVQYLTDGGEEVYHPAVKAVLEALSIAPDRQEQQAIKDAGFWIILGDCICIGTSKGVINTGHDNF